MVSNPEVFNNNSPRSPITPTITKKPSARKPLCLFTNISDVKKKTAIRQVGAAESKRKEIKSVTTLWELRPKQKVNSKISNQIIKSLYNWIINHPQVVQ